MNKSAFQLELHKATIIILSLFNIQWEIRDKMTLVLTCVARRRPNVRDVNYRFFNTAE